MAARRCTFCSVNYPNIAQFETCPIHDEPTTLHTNLSPDENWQARFEKLKRQFAEEQRVFPIIHGVEPYEEDGLLWLRQDELYRAGARLSSIGEGFYLFELDDGWVYETQGWDNPRRRWWVERVLESTEEETSPPTTSAVALSSTESATS